MYIRLDYQNCQSCSCLSFKHNRCLVSVSCLRGSEVFYVSGVFRVNRRGETGSVGLMMKTAPSTKDPKDQQLIKESCRNTTALRKQKNEELIDDDFKQK